MLNIKTHFRICLIVLSVLFCIFVTAWVVLGGMNDIYSSTQDRKTNETYEFKRKTEVGKYYGNLSEVSKNFTNKYVVVRQKSYKVSFYAYTESVSDDNWDAKNRGPGGIAYPSVERNSEGNEAFFNKGSEIALITLDSSGNVIEDKVLLENSEGVFRDPDVSFDGTKLLYSYKAFETLDDYHLYIYDFVSGSTCQVTFGQGVADIEGKWIANDKIVFNSTRDIQRVDCFTTTVSNMFILFLGENYENNTIYRVGYDQVHTTYPTVTSDGRIIYTRWDYSDRNQMFVQGVFQMNLNGTGQTELFANGLAYPTSLLHTREIPGSPDKYLSIAAGHHTKQGGKLCVIDLNQGENEREAVSYVKEKPNPLYPVEGSDAHDKYAQSGAIYKYPYAINEYEYFVAYAPNGWKGGTWAENDDAVNTRFDIYYVNTQTGSTDNPTMVCLNLDGNSDYPVSQFVPVITREVTQKADMNRYGEDTGTYYVGDVYEGEAMYKEDGTRVQRGEVAYLRVVAIEYRPYTVGANSATAKQSIDFLGGTGAMYTTVGTANASWDVKRVIGITDVEPDGSAFFKVPSETPVFFQLLDKDGELVQSMRSWSTLMPGETFSCVGCHENKSTAPILTSKMTMAMKKGIQNLRKDLWMENDPQYADYDPYTDSEGFSYSETIQPILDDNCISCHTNDTLALDKVQVPNGDRVSSPSNSGQISLGSTPVRGPREKFNYYLSYLLLTNSKYKPPDTTPASYRGDSVLSEVDYNASYTNWISSMSETAMLKAYQRGSSKSRLIDILQDGTHMGKLSESDLNKLRAWIDLGVPFRGAYDEHTDDTWNSRDKYTAEKGDNQRDYYDTQNRISKQKLAGVATTTPYTVQYYKNGNLYAEDYANGYNQLFIDSTSQSTFAYEPGDKVVINSPNSNYMYVNLNHYMKTSLLYSPTGIFEITMPSLDEMQKCYPYSFYRYSTGCITTYIPSNEDLKRQSNLAINSFDVYGEDFSFYPHASAGNSYPNTTSPSFLSQPRNAIDGFTNNKGHGQFPNQSWGMTESVADGASDAWYKIDFGRDVYIDKIVVYVRDPLAKYSPDHDVNIYNITIEFDGVLYHRTITGHDSEAGIVFKLDQPVKASTIKFGDFAQKQGQSRKWKAITEFQVIGTNL